MRRNLSRLLGGLAAAATVLLAGCGGGVAEPSASLRSVLSATVASPFVPATGVWWNASEAGSGFTFEVQGNLLVMSSYGYDSGGRAQWYVGALPQQSDGSFSGALSAYQGGQTLTGAWKAASAPTTAATADVTFTTSTQATLRVSSNGATRTVALERASFSTPALSPSAASFDSGLWYNPAEDGRGFMIEVQGGVVVLSSYMYDADGHAVWYLMSGTLQGGNAFSGDLAQYAGGQTLIGAWRAPTQVAASPGRLSFAASSRTAGTLTLPDGRQVPLQRFIVSSAAQATVTPPVPADPAPVATGSVDAGRTYWNTVCTTCHGLARTSVALNASEDKIRTAINGKISYMAFLRGVITGDDIANVSAYLRSGP